MVARPHVDDIAGEQDQQQACVVPGGIRQQRQSHADEAVKAEFLQNTRVQHRGRSGRRGVGRGRPCVEWEERNQNAEANEQGEVDGIAGAGIDLGRRAAGEP